MKTEKYSSNDELNQFMNRHESALGQVTMNLERAKIEYEKALRKFVINHVTSKAHFKTRFINSLTDTLNLVSSEPTWVVMGDSALNVMTYEQMISDEIYCLKEISPEAQEELT